MENTPETSQAPAPVADERAHSCGKPRGYRRFRAYQRPFPLANITETGEGYVLEVVAPGRQKSDFSIALHERTVTVAAQVTPSAQPWRRKHAEYSLAPFRRSFELADDADAETLQATYQDGVLVVQVAKQAAEPDSARVIAIA